MRVPDVIRQCVVFVGFPAGNKLSFHGTAFFVSVPSDAIRDIFYGYLVTAEHVASRLDAREYLLRCNTSAGGSIVLRASGAKWYYHPDGPTAADVAAFPFNPPDTIEWKSIPTSMFLTDETIQKARIGTGDGVFMTGLFTRFSGKGRNIPIVRMGNVAMMPDEPIPTERFGDMDAYLIEGRSIGGLSGSPVFVQRTVPGVVAIDAGSETMAHGEFYLMGLMHGHWDLPPQSQADTMIIDIDEKERVNMGIAIVVPAKKILEVLNHPELTAMRRSHDEELRRQGAPTTDVAASEDPGDAQAAGARKKPQEESSQT